MAGGRVRGQLYMVAHYPGFVPSEAEYDWVFGDVYCLRFPELTYLELDRYESCADDDPLPHKYRRTPPPVLLDSGDWIDAFAHVYAADLTGKQRIMSGDYLSLARPERLELPAC